MKKGIWPITIGILLMLYQIAGIDGVYVDFENAYSVCYPIFGFTLEWFIGYKWLYYVAMYIVGVLSILLIIWGFNAFIKDSPELVGKSRLIASYQAIKDTRTLVQCAVLIALYVVLDMFQIKTPFLEFSFSFLALAGIAYIAGPVTGFFCGGICDILNYLIAPQGALLLGITFTAMLTGFVMGLFWYKREISLLNIIISHAIVTFVLELAINTYWISTLVTTKGYLALLAPRAIKSVVAFPLEIVLIFFVITLLAKINKINKPINKNQSKK